MINIQNINATYGKNIVLKDISININQGSITSIIGSNGSGKSTLLKCIAKQIIPISGEISIDGENIKDISIKNYAKQLSYLKQSRDLPIITVENLVFHGRFPHLGFPRILSDKDIYIVKCCMQKIGIWELRHKFLSQLSGGECQKAYLAMAMAQNANILLLDEPTTYLDIKHQLELLNIISRLKDEKKTVITVLHDIDSAFRISDNICIISNGHVVFFGCPSNISNSLIDDVFGVASKFIMVDGEKRIILR